ncbi:hypothetical protein DBA29_17275 [Xenophilus aerolatus]|nr:hypothetical protein [Xenophilus aerolatus]
MRRLNPVEVLAGALVTLDLSGVSSVQARYSGGSESSESVQVAMDKLYLRTDVANAYTLGGVTFRVGTVRHFVKSNGNVEINLSAATGIGTKVGTMTPSQGVIELTSWPIVAPLVQDFRGALLPPAAGPDNPYSAYMVVFRLATAPVRPSSFSMQGTMRDGTTFNVAADANGVINAARVKGRINYQTGVVQAVFVTPSAPAGFEPVDLSFLGIPGVSTGYLDMAQNETLKYNAVAFSYLPLDAELLGIDPVRLPSDGRVPIFRPGGVAVVGNAQTTGSQTVANGDVINVGRTRLSRVRVIGHDGEVIPVGYTEDLEAGTVTFTDVAGYSQPVKVEHRIEDMLLVRDAQIDGTLSFTRPLTHDYPPGSRVSSAFMAGDLRARVSLMFDQASWDKVTFSDALVGNPAPATYDSINHPVEILNDGGTSQRWALDFISTTTFRVVGEKVGVILTGASITADCSPLNPATGQPYFTIRKEGWGSGWAVGNIVRLNTVGALTSPWIVRTVKQGPESGENYEFTLLLRGDVDNPL